jgi:hypothetical protein
LKYWIHTTDSRKFRLAEWLQDFNWVSDDRLIDRWHIDASVNEIRPDDIVFIWNNDEPDKTGVIVQGKVVPLPDKFPLAEREPDYLTDKKELTRLTGLSHIAVKYTRLCLGNPITRPEFETNDILRTILPIIDQGQRISKIPEAAGKQIEWLFKGRTTMIDLTYCQT